LSIRHRCVGGRIVQKAHACPCRALSGRSHGGVLTCAVCHGQATGRRRWQHQHARHFVQRLRCGGRREPDGSCRGAPDQRERPDLEGRADPVDRRDGPRQAAVHGIPGPGLFLDANVASAATFGSGDRSYSSASVADVSLGLGSITPIVTIKASVLRSYALAKCGTGGATTTGGANIVGLKVIYAGTTYQYDLGTGPNQTIEIPDLIKITVNEQTSSPGSLTVRALHIEIPPSGPLSLLLDGDIVISESHADITCEGGDNPPPPCQVLDFISGGGQIVGLDTSFGGAGGQRPNSLMGHFNLVDKTRKIHVQGTTLTDYQPDPAHPSTGRVLTYSGTVNNQAATIVVTEVDNGEPGTNDTIKVTTSTGPSWQGGVQGNIPLHKPACGGSTKGGRH